MLRSLTMLNEMGDLTLAWTEDQDEKMETLIEKMMAKGVTFFIIENRMGLRSKLKDAGDAHKHRALAIPDEDIAKFVDDGTAEIVPTSQEKVGKTRISRDKKEIVKKQSVGVKRKIGG